MFFEASNGGFLRHSQHHELYLVRFLEGQLRARRGTYDGRIVDIGSRENVYKLSSTTMRFIDEWEREGIVVKGKVNRGNRTVIDV